MTYIEVELKWMVKVNQDEYRLSKFPKSHFKNLFNGNEFKITKSFDRGSLEWDGKFEAILEMGKEGDDGYFEVVIKCGKDKLPLKLVERAKLVIDEVVEMDDAARLIGDNGNENELLAYISIDESKAHFCY